MALSIIIPVYNDSAALRILLGDLLVAQAGAQGVEIIVVDGGSQDDPAAVCADAGSAVTYLASARGRGAQLAAGVEASTGEVLWMLHADSRVESDAVRVVAGQSHGWGRCHLRFDPPSAGMRMVAFFMHWRSRLTGICTGDQGLWMMRPELERAGGMPRQPLMEDIELSRRLKLNGRPRVLGLTIRTSPRRWQTGGLWRTIFRMWLFRLRYFFGATPEALERDYRRGSNRVRSNGGLGAAGQLAAGKGTEGKAIEGKGIKGLVEGKGAGKGTECQ